MTEELVNTGKSVSSTGAEFNLEGDYSIRSIISPLAKPTQFGDKTREDVVEKITKPIGGTSSSELLEWSSFDISKYSLHEGVTFPTWKIVANISSKLLYFDELIVCLECLIDKEQKIYEEREFQKSLFDGFQLDKGALFKICIYERKNQQMIEVKEGEKLVSSDDFPIIDFFSEFGDMNLEKKGA
jgi:hypothetical protein